MKRLLSSRKYHHIKRVSNFLIVVALVLVLCFVVVLIPTNTAYATQFTVTLTSSTTDGQSNVGQIEFRSVKYNLPTSITTETVSSVGAAMYPPSGYVYDHWEASGGVSLFDFGDGTASVSVNGDGTLKAVFRPGPSFDIAVSPSSLTINPSSSGSATVTVYSRNGFSGSVDLGLSLASGGVFPTWLSANFNPDPRSVSSGSSATSTLQLSVSSSAPSGTYAFTVSGYSGTIFRTASLSLTVLQGPVLAVSPTSLSFAVAETQKSFTISNTGGGTLTWSLSSNQGWLTASPTSGSGNAAVTVNVNRSGLDSGTYSGIITINSNGGSQTVSVSMQVQVQTQNPVLANVGISPPNYSVPVTPPVTVSRGGQFRAWYFINNPNSQSINVGLGLSIISPSGQEISDSARDLIETVPANAANYVLDRFFQVPSSAEPGTYTVIYGLWSGAPGSSTKYTSLTKSGWLNAVAQFTVTLTSSTTDGQSNVGQIEFRSVKYNLPTSITTETVSSVGAAMYPPSGYVYDHWEASGGVSLFDFGDGTASVSVNGDGTLKAVFRPGPSFDIAVSPSSLTINPSSSGSATVTVYSRNGFSGSVDLGLSLASGGVFPTWLSANFNPDPRSVSSGSSATSTLQLSVSSSAPSGTYAFTVSGYSGTIFRTASLSLTIPPGPDTTSPETTITRTSGPSGTIDYDDVTFTWTGSDDVTPTTGLVYSYHMEGYDTDWSDWTADTSKQYSRLSNRSYIFRVKARDLAGNVDASAAERAFTVDAEWSFAIITDLHIGWWYTDYGTEGWDHDTGGPDYRLTDRLNGIVKWINENEEKYNIDFVAVLGDISDSAEYSEFLKAREALNNLNVPYIPVIGNHDIWPYIQGKGKYEEIWRDKRDKNIGTITDWAGSAMGDEFFQEIFWQQNNQNVEKIETLFGTSWSRQVEGLDIPLQNYVFTHNGVKFIALDFIDRLEDDAEEQPESAGAKLYPDTITWLTAKLGEGERTILLSHHPICTLTSCFSISDAKNIRAIVSNSGADLLANFNGHLHYNFRWNYGGVIDTVWTETLCREQVDHFIKDFPTDLSDLVPVPQNGDNIRIVKIGKDEKVKDYDSGNIKDEDFDYPPGIFEAKSPVDLIITDPEGLTITKEIGEVIGMVYLESDVDLDNDLEDIVILDKLKIGDYKVTVIPESGASPTDTYTLEFSRFDSRTVLAENVQIGDIPSNPYTVTIEENFSPYSPSNPSPGHNATGVPINTDLSWTGGDPDAGDVVTYDVYFGTTETLSLKGTIGPYPAAQSSVMYAPGVLVDGTAYYWQIVARDNHGVTREGPVWHFTAGALSQDEPSPEVGFASLIAEGELVIAYNFDPFTTVPTAVNGWTWYDPTLPPAQNNLAKLHKNTAYWIKVTQECWLTYGTQNYHLAAGWNNPVWLGC
jgi:predicted MPP superfamily phosphohydrolase